MAPILPQSLPRRLWLCKENAATQIAVPLMGPTVERYYFLCFTFGLNVVAPHQGGLKTTNRNQSMFRASWTFFFGSSIGKFYHVASSWHPSGFSDSFLQFSEPLPKAPLSLPGSWGRAPGCRSISHQRSSACRGFGVRFLRSISLPGRGNPECLCASYLGGDETSKRLEMQHISSLSIFLLLFRFLVDFEVYIFSSQS